MAPHRSRIHTSGIALLCIKIMCISCRTATPSVHPTSPGNMLSPSKAAKTICTGTSARDKPAQITDCLVELQGAPRCNRVTVSVRAGCQLPTHPASPAASPPGPSYALLN
ncbi:TPA: hypothetical protein ACH3X3_004945 [Trebouxia sp. C0006]